MVGRFGIFAEWGIRTTPLNQGTGFSAMKMVADFALIYLGAYGAREGRRRHRRERGTLGGEGWVGRRVWSLLGRRGEAYPGPL